MIVAAGTVQCQPEECLSHDADRIFEFILSHGGSHPINDRYNCVVSPCYQEPDSTQCFRIGGSNQVTCQLPADKLIVRHVAVQSLNHPVAIRPGIGAREVTFKPIALTKPDDIQPVPRPSLAIVW